MEKIVLLLIPLLSAFLLLRLAVIPMRTVLRFSIQSCGGLVCLWLLNTVSAVTGIFFPVNAITAAMAGFCGLPGITLMALLTLLT